MVLYLYFGRQCPGAALESGARAAAELLGLPFATADVSLNPELARKHQMFFPGLVVAEGFKGGFPGSPEQMAESIRTRAPLPGKQEYVQLPEAVPDKVEVITPENVEILRGLCIPAHLCEFWQEKEDWLKSFAIPCLGLVGYREGQPVAVVEMLPREHIPYPIPEYNGLFITCMYGRYDAQVDYRRGLLEEGMPLLRSLGYAKIGIVAGRATPYPNGPVELLARAGFREGTDLGRIILRHCWAEQVFMERQL